MQSAEREDAAVTRTLRLTPLVVRPSASLRVPGSKSITNRALLCAALAPGVSTIEGALLADDTRAMLSAVGALGASVNIDDESSASIRVAGVDVSTVAHRTDLRVDARQSGTTARFMLPVLASCGTRVVLDGSDQLRNRPFEPLVDALRTLGASVESTERDGRLPLSVGTPARGGHVSMTGKVSSQFISGLLIAGALMPEGLSITINDELVSVPYVEMTEKVMEAFGVKASGLSVARQPYAATRYCVEPDASAASYFFAAAAITGGQITVEGLGSDSMQGDLGFVDVLEAMGATVDRSRTSTTVTGPERLHGVDVDMRHISDTAQTLAAAAVFASSRTRVRGIGFIRAKETDRIQAMVTELRRAGIDARDDGDGFTIEPGTPRPSDFETYDDHRMAMSLALLSLRTPGIGIKNPGCVEKTYPRYFDDLTALRQT